KSQAGYSGDAVHNHVKTQFHGCLLKLLVTVTLFKPKLLFFMLYGTEPHPNFDSSFQEIFKSRLTDVG
ncbi:1683_t:CDS:2, partial [Acaulospora morrowiae]